MKKGIILAVLSFLTAAQAVLYAQEYYPEGTKWTEIRLDTLKYDSWYSKVGDEWVPNFETIDYYVKGDYTTKNGELFKCVYSNGPEWKDSLTLLVQTSDVNGERWVCAGEPNWACPGNAYLFDWDDGKVLVFSDIVSANTTSIVRVYGCYGTVGEVKEGFFGGARQLKYVEVNGKSPEVDKTQPIKYYDTKGGRIIQGIGITEWNDDKCLFGPVIPYAGVRQMDHTGRGYSNYRSMLVHFERNGEVLYDDDLTGFTAAVDTPENVTMPATTGLFDLQGRRVNGQPQRGIYIGAGDRRKVMKK